MLIPRNGNLSAGIFIIPPRMFSARILESFVGAMEAFQRSRFLIGKSITRYPLPLVASVV